MPLTEKAPKPTNGLLLSTLLIIIFSSQGCKEELQEGYWNPSLRSGSEQKAERRTSSEAEKLLPEFKDWMCPNPKGPFLTSPKWIDNNSIIATGKRGIGLYHVNLEDNSVKSLISDFYGVITVPSSRTKGKYRSVCIKNKYPHMDNNWKTIRIEKISRHPVIENDKRNECLVETFGTGTEKQSLIFKDDSRKIQLFFQSYRGVLKIVKGGEEKTIEGFSVWGVRVSPDGDKIAYCKGPLSQSRLFIYYINTSRAVEISTGAHPVWFPDSTQVAFDFPSTSFISSGKDGGFHSSIWIYNLESSTAKKITTSSEIVAMQPDISPSGKQMVFSDWRSGRIYIINLKSEAAIP